ncbi:MATE family efflux transporter [Lachnoanaerobaculum sp. Marseille-Q4761]|jgi:MATE efflux family protein|uniref:MATE family efflux transporter n=1 Tax=Lachnoanaerobaculum sp. Marseille-Q4761 TaxID=2819511 RepID=UPI001AA14362|nr:MATE family efflux transporter [Lachnoanaerobaculum sp. Marseille-Q4761]MBO1870365.1 MATE family efflux transporter [Lachnoanaerobaculum sp. Marseille-Q4761]
MERTKKLDMTKGNITFQLLQFFFPILLGTFFQQLYNTADAVIVGQNVGKIGLAAVGGTTSTLINLFIGIFVGLSSGFSVIISQHYGAKNNKLVSACVHTALAFSLIVGIVVSIFGAIFSKFMLANMNVPENMMQMALPYLQIYFLGLAPNLIYNMGAGLLRAVGDSKTPLIFLVISCFVNIVLDIVLIQHMDMGVTGAAIATVASQIVSAVLVIIVLCRRDDALKLRLNSLHINFYELKKMVSIGTAAAMQSAMYTIANILIQASINSLGTDTIAAFTAYGKIDTLFFMTIQSLGISVTTFTGQNYGYGNKERVKKGIIYGMILSVIVTGIVMLLLKLFGRSIYTLFTQDENVLNIGTQMLNFMVVAFPAYIIIEIFSGSLRGIGDSWIPMIITASGVCILRILWILAIVPKYPNIFTILWAYPISWVTTSILFLIYMFGFSKMKAWIKLNMYFN